LWAFHLETWFIRYNSEEGRQGFDILDPSSVSVAAGSSHLAVDNVALPHDKLYEVEVTVTREVCELSLLVPVTPIITLQNPAVTKNRD